MRALRKPYLEVSHNLDVLRQKKSMSSSPIIPAIGEVLKKFKERCGRRGWETGEEGDWVKRGEALDVFIYCKSISAGTVSSILTSSEHSIKEKNEVWRVGKASHVAFVTMGFGEDVRYLLERRPELLERTVLYDMDRGQRIGKAVSPVFAEFERFLEEEYGVHLERLTAVRTLETVIS
jgi:hypothetical protein